MKKFMTLLLCIALLAAGCIKKEHIENGTTKVSYDKNMPTDIQSTEIFLLDCEASTVSSSGFEESGLEEGRYYFKCKLDSSAKRVSGTYCFQPVHTSKEDAEEYSFETDSSFMEELDKIIKDSHIIVHNGNHSKTYGLPDDYGYSISAEYMSGERISCSNNSSNFFPFFTIKSLWDLFSGAGGST